MTQLARERKSFSWQQLGSQSRQLCSKVRNNQLWPEVLTTSMNLE